MEGNLTTFIKIINVPPFVPEILLLGISLMVAFMHVHRQGQLLMGALVLIVPDKKPFKCPPVSDFSNKIWYSIAVFHLY